MIDSWQLPFVSKFRFDRYSFGNPFHRSGSGTVTLSNDNNSFSGILFKEYGGAVRVTSLANSGVNSAAGAGNEIRLGNNSSLEYIGTGTATTNRKLTLVRGARTTLASTGGAMVFTGTVDNQSTGDKILSPSGNFNGAESRIDGIDVQVVLGLSFLDDLDADVEARLVGSVFETPGEEPVGGAGDE